MDQPFLDAALTNAARLIRLGQLHEETGFGTAHRVRALEPSSTASSVLPPVPPNLTVTWTKKCQGCLESVPLLQWLDHRLEHRAAS